MRLLLHACCGVCSAYVPEKLMPDFDVTVYFENSNLYPEDEFYRRRDAALTMAQGFGLPFITADYASPAWFGAVRGMAAEPERGRRCDKCIAFRLDRTMRFAQENDFAWVATTLSVSRRKNAEQINRLGDELARIHNLSFLGRDWKKGNGELLSQKRAVEAGIYRQDYCGCVYSLKHKQKTVILANAGIQKEKQKRNSDESPSPYRSTGQAPALNLRRDDKKG